MSNRDNPHGFQPLMRSTTGGPGAGCMGAHKLAGDGTALFVFDVVKRAASGTKKTLCITAATAAAANVGVNLIYGAASTATDHIIIPGGFGQMFEAQEDGVTHGGANVAALDVGLNANLIATAGNATTKRSKHEIGGASIASTNTLDFHLMGLFPAVDNDYGANARLLVTFNNAQFESQVAGA